MAMKARVMWYIKQDTDHSNECLQLAQANSDHSNRSGHMRGRALIAKCCDGTSATAIYEMESWERRILNALRGFNKVMAWDRPPPLLSTHTSSHIGDENADRKGWQTPLT